MLKWIRNLFKRTKDNNMTFDILVFEEDELADGSMGMKQHMENGVNASSAKELASTYAMCGQRIKIIRTYNDQPTGDINANALNIKSAVNNVAPAPAQQAAPPPKPIVPQKPAAPIKPKFFTIGGIECKQEGDKIYQKQWVLVSTTDMENYRLISDNTNKIVNLVGKHLEVKRWVLVEDKGNIDTANAESIN